MALTPHEERQIHQIEESLLHNDPGLAARMSRVWRPRRKPVIAASCLLAILVALGIWRPVNSLVTLCCVTVAALAAGWCLGTAGVSCDPMTWLRRLRLLIVRCAHLLTTPVRWLARRRH